MRSPLSFLSPSGRPLVFGTGRNRLTYHKMGDGPPLVLVHGLSGSGAWWKHNLPALKAKYTCHVVDLVGYGGNRALRPLLLGQAGDILAEFLGSLPGGQAHLLAHSMGGQIACAVAANHPAQVNKLILAAPSGLVRSDLVRMAMRLPVAAYHSPLTFLPTLAYDALRAGPLNLVLSTLDILATDTTELLEKILAPTLLLWGDRDNLVPESVGVEMAKRIPDVRIEVIEGAGHVLMWDHPRTFNRYVLDFLATD